MISPRCTWWGGYGENNYQVTYQTLELIGKPFEDLSILLTWFKPLRSALVKKYYSLTEVETVQFLASEDFLDPEHTLTLFSFHMDIRKRAREQGE